MTQKICVTYLGDEIRMKVRSNMSVILQIEVSDVFGDGRYAKRFW